MTWARGGSDERPARPIEERVLAAWHVWLSALATDAEAAFAAALAYEALDDAGRDAWLDALEQDAPKIDVPRVALYAPLLSVESDPARRARIRAAVGRDPAGDRTPRPIGRALRGVSEDGDRLVALVMPLYLDFVHVLACRFRPGHGFVWVRHDPIVRDGDAPGAGAMLDAVPVEQTPLPPVVEELAHAVVAHRRTGRALPEGLGAYADLFDPDLGG